MLLQNLSGPGLDADIALPPLDTLHAHNIFELDFQLSCPGVRDRDCPIWDHTVQLFVCCDDPSGHAAPCEPSDPTVWVEPYSSSSSDHRVGLSGSAPMRWLRSSSSSAASWAVPQCGRELGRWITPFRLGRHALHVYALHAGMHFEPGCRVYCSVLLCTVCAMPAISTAALYKQQ